MTWRTSAEPSRRDAMLLLSVLLLLLSLSFAPLFVWWELRGVPRKGVWTSWCGHQSSHKNPESGVWPESVLVSRGELRWGDAIWRGYLVCPPGDKDSRGSLTLLDLCASSSHSRLANLVHTVSSWTDDPKRESNIWWDVQSSRAAPRVDRYWARLIRKPWETQDSPGLRPPFLQILS